MLGHGRSWPNLGRRTANMLALASFALLILVGVLAAAMAERVNRTADWVARSLEAEAIATELLNRVQDLELGQRGYLLTRSDAFLAPYDEARVTIPQALGRLAPLVADNPEQTARVERMRPLIEELLATATTTVEFGRKGQFAEAIEIVKTGRDQQVLQSFRSLVDAFRLAENGILGQRQAAESRARAIMLGLVLISLASAAAAALGALLMSGALIRELRERTDALAEEIHVRKEAQAMMGETQKIESIGLLAGGVAHDFNNLMTIVIGNLDSAERRLARAGPADPAAISRLIAAAMQGARRAASLTQRLPAFSRQQVLAPEPMTDAARAESVPAHQRNESAPASGSSARPGEVVLLVEDDEDVRDSTVALLGELGYSVLAARNGDEALVRLQGSERIDILFTDVVLPQGMNGRALALEASTLRPGLPVLFTTGYARNAIIRDGGLDPGAHFLGKPYTHQELAQKLRAALDAPAKA
jgi:CHASE3 domain sensor protein/CheY-like chemotaxis protein